MRFITPALGLTRAYFDYKKFKKKLENFPALPKMTDMPEDVVLRANIPTTTAVIVTYNRLDLLKKVIKAVLNQQSDYLSHIFIVNNNSNDGTKEYLTTLSDDRVTVYNLKENIGGAGGFNYGVRKFMEETEDELVWLMDDDTLTNQTTLSSLQKAYSAQPKVGFLASNVRYKSFDGEPAYMNTQIVRLEPHNGATYNDLNLPDLYPVEIVNSSFVSVAIPRWIVTQIGLPQKEYFIWGDDIEYTNRAADIYPGYMISASIVAHLMKENTLPGNIWDDTDSERLWRYKYEYRNRVLTETRVNPEARNSILGSGKWEVSLMKQNKMDPLRKEKLAVMDEGNRLAADFNPEIEYVGEKPRNVRSMKKIKEYKFLLKKKKQFKL